MKILCEKEEIARNEQFLLFPQCFLLNQKLVPPFVITYDITSLFAAELEELKIGILGEGSSRLHNFLMQQFTILLIDSIVFTGAFNII